jgi:DNA ligase 1
MKMIQSSEVFESKTRTGAAKFWQNHIYQDGKRFFTGSSHWQVNKQGVKSKVTFAEPYIVEPKNIGRANETSPFQQALLEFESNIKKYQDKGYSVQGAKKVESDPLPMLAHKFRDHGHKVKYPVYVQPKLDGMRMLFDGKRGWSRGNKAILPEVIAHLTNIDTRGHIFDGELILPGNVPLQETMSAAKKFRAGISDTLQYHVYDLVIPDKTYTERLEILRQLFKGGGGYNKDIILTKTMFFGNESIVLEFHQLVVAEGYEGTIIRDPNGKYEIGHRSYSLLKLKDFQDEEFKIVDVLDGGGVSAGQAIFRLETAEGKLFDSTPEAGHEQRKEWFKDRKKLIGKWATAKFYGKTKDGIPVFNNTVAIRDEADFK